MQHAASPNLQTQSRAMQGGPAWPREIASSLHMPSGPMKAPQLANPSGRGSQPTRSAEAHASCLHCPAQHAVASPRSLLRGHHFLCQRLPALIGLPLFLLIPARACCAAPPHTIGRLRLFGTLHGQRSNTLAQTLLCHRRGDPGGTRAARRAIPHGRINHQSLIP